MIKPRESTLPCKGEHYHNSKCVMNANPFQDHVRCSVIDGGRCHLQDDMDDEKELEYVRVNIGG